MIKLEEMLDSCGYDYSLNEDGDIEATLMFDDNRKQKVIISTSATSVEGLNCCSISSPACEDIKALPEKMLRSCLKNSSKHKMGAWELRGDALYFCIKTIDKIREEELQKLIDYVGVVADDFESKYCGTDKL